MINRKILTFLKSLSKKELGKFELYLQSPYFNQSEEITFIYHHLKEFISVKNKNLSFDEYLNNKLPKEKKAISKVNLDKYLSRINKFLLDFISMEQFRSNEFDKNAALIKYLIEKDELQLFDKTYNKTKTILDKEKISFQNYLNRFLLERQKTNYLSVHSVSRKGKQNLQETDDALDDFYLTQKFNLAIIKKTRERSNNEKYNYEFTDILHNYLNKNQNSLLNMLYQAYYVIFDQHVNKKKSFKKLCTFFNEKADQLDEIVAYNFGVLILNQAKDVLKNDEHYPFIFELYKIQLKNNILYYKGKLFDTLFKNIVDVATRLNELDWCEKFIEENSDKIIPKEQAKDITNYCKARLSFFKGKYEITRDFIQTLHFNDIYYKMAVRRLEIMVYVELKEDIYLESLVNAFRVSLTPERSPNLSAKHRDLNKTFINFIVKILKLSNGLDSINLEEINKINTNLKTKNVVNKIWLQNKLDQLYQSNIESTF